MKNTNIRTYMIVGIYNEIMFLELKFEVMDYTWVFTVIQHFFLKSEW